MKIGIVGSESIKFTHSGEIEARIAITKLLIDHKATEVISGGCHLGGIDKWAIEEAKNLGLKTTEYLPKFHGWEAYKERNLQIANNSDIVYCITVKRLPTTYEGMKFQLCYHCKTNDHVKSGGCWTMHKAKHGHLIIVENEE